MKQTAVEWFNQEINKLNVGTDARVFIAKLLKQAKELEKEQIIETCGGKEAFMESAGLKPKQETLEEAAINNYKELYEGEPLTQDVPIDAFKQGAKWQQEQAKEMEKEQQGYNKEEVIKILLTFRAENPRYINLWFEQFKKK